VFQEFAILFALFSLPPLTQSRIYPQIAAFFFFWFPLDVFPRKIVPHFVFLSYVAYLFFFFECFFLQPNTFCPKCLPHDLTVPNATALRSFSPSLLVVASRFRLCSVCVRWPMHVVCETCMFCDLGFSWCSSFIWPIVLFQYTIFRLSLRDDGHFLDCTVICFFTLHT